MKHEGDFEEEISAAEAYIYAEKLKKKISYETFTDMYERIKDKYPEGYDEKLKAQEVSNYYKTRSLFDMAVGDVMVDLVKTDISMMHLSEKEQLRRIEAKVEQYALDPAYRNKYAGMAR